MLAALTSFAQTNSTIPIKTNALPSAEQIHAAQVAAVKKAMPQYWDWEQDSVSDVVTISLNQYETLYDDDRGVVSLQLDVVAKIAPKKDLPETIGIRLISHTADWKYLDDHDFTIRFDDKKFTPDNPFYSNKVRSDATVIEQVWPDFTIQQFHDIAWSTNVIFKLGYKNFEIPYAARLKWKLLWKYFDFVKSDQDADLQKEIGW
jgi:hypothetical protein